MKKIKLTKDKFALVDDQDFGKVNQFSWYFHKNGYAMAYIGGGRKNAKQIKMHRLIMNPPSDLKIDHINGNGLDNQKSNLRICTQSNNLMNQKKRIGCSSQYKGACWIKSSRLWESYIRFFHKKIHLGYFEKERYAAMAYDIAAKDLFGDFARLNFPNAIHG